MKVAIVDKKSGARRNADDAQNLALDRPSIIHLKLAPENVARYERRGDDLVLVLKDGQEISIPGFFAKYPSEEAADDSKLAGDETPPEEYERNELVLEDDNGVLWWGQYPEQWTEFHFTEIEWNDAGGFIWWPWLLGALGGVSAGAIAVGLGKDNDPPVALDDQNSGNEDGGPVTGNVLTNDSDPDNDSLTVTSFTVAGDTTVHKAGDTVIVAGVGEFTLKSDGSYSFTPDANWNGTVPTITYTINDGEGGSDTADLVITIDPVVDLTAGDDSNVTDEDTPVDGTVVDNDSTISGGELTYEKASNPANGTVVVNADGTYTYTPNPNFNGTDSFTYTVTDADSGESLTQTVTITVNPVVDLVAADDSNTTNEDTAVSGTVATNDSTTSGGELTYEKASDPENGTVVIAVDGSYIYVPNANYNGTDSFTYTVTDADSGESLTQTVTITINPVVDLTAADDSNTTNEDTPVSGTVATNDSTTSGGELTFAKASDPANGTVVVNADGTYTYTPNPNFNGTDSFTYTVTDLDSGESLTRTVDLTINPVVDLTAADDSNTTNEDTPVSGTVATNDSTTSDGELTYVKASDPENGMVVIAVDGSYIYVPNANYNGTDSFTYTVTDADSGESLTQTVTITINPVVDLTAADDSNTTNEDTPVSGTVATNDSTTSDGELTFAKASDPANGTVVVNADGTYTYTPNLNFNGTDSFTYTVTDVDSGESLTQTVEITVNPVVDLTAADDSNTTEEDTPVDGTVAINDSTTSGGELTYEKASNPANGTVVVNADGTYTYTPNPNFNGTDSFTYTVTDVDSGESLTQTVEITVNPVVDLTAADDSNTTNEDTPVSGTVATNDSTTSDGELTYVKASDPANGTVVIAVDGSYIYVPNANYNGTDSFTYTVTDADSGESLTQTVTITINPVNDAPVIVEDAQADSVVEAGNLDEGTVVAGTPTASGSFTATDVDAGDTQSWSAAGTPDTTYGTFAVDESGNWTYTLRNDLPATQALNEGDSVPLTFTVRVTDGLGAYDEQTVTIIITGTNDAPVANADVDEVTESGVADGGNSPAPGTQTADGNVLGNDSDVDDGETDTLQVSAVRFGESAGTVGDPISGTYGSLVLNADGTYIYTLNNGLTKTQELKQGDRVPEIFTYTVTDANGATSTTTLTITVNGTNDQPEITSTDEDALGAVTEAGTGVPGNPTTTGTLTATDVDSDAEQKWSIDGNANGTYGTISIDPETGEWTYTLDDILDTTQQLNNGDVRTETFTARVTDQHGAYSDQIITVTVNGSNDDIKGSDTGGEDHVTVTEDILKTGSLQEYATDVDNDLVVTEFQIDIDGNGIADTFTFGEGGNYTSGQILTLTKDGDTLGTLTINEDGTYTFTPAPNYAGNVPPITYTLTEEDGVNSITQTLTFDMVKVADAPGLEANKTISTDEDVSKSLGLIAPIITDEGTGTGNDDYPERIGEITLTIGGAGADGVTLTTGLKTLAPDVNGKITIVLVDASGDPLDSHVSDVPPAGDGVYYLTEAEYEALTANPTPESGDNFTVTVDVTSYEVDGTGAKIPDVVGASSSQVVTVDVQAVTDGATLTIDGGDTLDLTGDEDSAISLSGLLTATRTSSDTNGVLDTDGSETYSYTVSGLPVGSVVSIDGSSYTVGATGSVSTPFSASFSDAPNITVTPPENFSGDITGVTITLNSRDTDSDSTGTITTESDSVTVNLYVSPVAGDVDVQGVQTNEDTPVAFLQNISVSDADGSEVINSISFDVPDGWVLTTTPSMSGMTVTVGPTGSVTIAFDDSLSQTEREAILDDFMITPPAHSSADANINLSITVTDSKEVNGQTVTDVNTSDKSVKITVDPVAEKVGVDSDDDGDDDVTMVGDHAYTAPGAEDTWFALGTNYTDASNIGGGFAGLGGTEVWSNEDGRGSGGNEFTYAVLSPTLSDAAPGDEVIGTEFRYSTDDGATWVTITYVGEAIWVPQQYLDTLQVKLPPDVSGTLTIGVQAGTVDYDDDTVSPPTTPPHMSGDGSNLSGPGVSVGVSGDSELSLITFDPVADGVTMALNGRATGLEDNEIPLSIKTTSTDPSETFDVTISGIPDGATITYNGTDIVVTGGSVTIEDFDNEASLTITPPLHSSDDFDLSVSAVSRDGGSVSEAVVRGINVSVTGVADVAEITLAPDHIVAESTLDNGDHKVALTNLVTSVTSPDADGSETITLRITGLDENFTVAGATLVFVGEGGEERVWMVAADKLGSVSIIVPENYSGTVDFKVAGVTTERDGDSDTGVLTDVSFVVTPSPEATITTSATLVEDVITLLDLKIVHQNDDVDEVLGDVYIPVDYSGDYTLYLDAAELPDAGLTIIDIDGVDYYVIPQDKVGGLGAVGDENLDGNLGDLNFKYDITDPPSDGSLDGSVTETKDGTLTLTGKPVTDAINASITGITFSGDATGTIADDVAGDDAAPDTVLITHSGSVTVNLHVASPDTDGSEHLVRVLIEGVPDGVTVDGASQISANSWLLIYDGSEAQSIGMGGIDVPIDFIVGQGASASDDISTIKITVQGQDRGNDPNLAARIEEDSVSWNLEINLTDGMDYTPPVINEWAYNDAFGTEDTGFRLNSVIDAAVSTSDSSQSYSYTVTITDLPFGTEVVGMTLSIIEGQPVYTATVTVEPNENSQTALDALMNSITITPPENENDNNSDFGFNAKLTASAVGGTSMEEDAEAVMPVTPVTDQAIVTVDVDDVGEGKRSLTATITVEEGDNGHGTIVDGLLYVQVDTTANAGGTVSVSGTDLVLQSVSGVDGIPDGDYYVIDVGATGGSVDLTYTAADGSTLKQPGDVTFTVYVQTQEAGDDNVATTRGSATAEVVIVNNGVTAEPQSQPSTGMEPSSSDKSQAIKLEGLNVALNDNDGSEAILSIMLAGLPVGFLIYVGEDADSASLASNAGGDGSTNTWILSSDGTLPPYVAILPPANWSGTLEGLTLVVESGETGLDEKLVEAIELDDVTVQPVANGIVINPTISIGTAGQIIDLNLNAAMADAAAATSSVADGSIETTTLQITGLGEFAAFYVGDELITDATYDRETDTYTIAGLSQDQLDDLGFVQAESAFTDQDEDTSGTQVTVKAWTVESDTDEMSAPAEGTLTLAVTPVLATTGSDSFLWDGEAINGKAGIDTVALRYGENIDRFDLEYLLSNIEVIDLSVSGANSIIGGLSEADVLSITGDGGTTLTIKGDSEDTVELSNEWSMTGTAENGYVTYTSLNEATLLIDEDIFVSGNVSYAA